MAMFYNCNSCGGLVSFLHMEYKNDNVQACSKCGGNSVSNLHHEDARQEIEEDLRHCIQQALYDNFGRVSYSMG